MRHTSCTDVESYNTCQYGGTYSFSTGLCVLMMSDAVPWSAFMKSIEPRFQCPCVAVSLCDLKTASLAELRFHC